MRGLCALGGAAALYGCCACLSVLGVSVWAQLRLFAGAAYRPRLLVFSRAVHLVLLAAARQGVCAAAARQRYGMQYAGRPRPAGFPSAAGRRGGGVCLSAQLFTRPGKVFIIINDSIFCGLRVSLMFKKTYYGAIYCPGVCLLPARLHRRRPQNDFMQAQGRCVGPHYCCRTSYDPLMRIPRRQALPEL